MGDPEYIAAFQQIVMPIAFEVSSTKYDTRYINFYDSIPRDYKCLQKNSWFQFAPDLVLVSAGFDAALYDPLVSERHDFTKKLMTSDVGLFVFRADVE